jgi:hypothetical protein
MSPPPELDLTTRIAGYEVMRECLRHQESMVQHPLGRLFGATPLVEAALPWYRGALGEIEVGRILARLGAEWTVLHSVPVGSGDTDIDHLVLGPPGIVAVNAKRHAGKRVWAAGRGFTVNGAKQPYVLRSLSEARRVRAILVAHDAGDIEVYSAIVVVDAAEVTTEAPDVPVLTPSSLTRWLTRLPPALAPARLAELVRLAQEPTTWHTRPSALDATVGIRFEALRKTVRSADLRRRVWALAATVGLIAASSTVPRLLLDALP